MSKFGGYEDEPQLAELYDFVPPCAGRADVDFYLHFARSAGGEIIELGCGTGRILIPIARAGIEITGIDISEFMLAKCRQKLLREPREVRERVRLIRGNMTAFNLKHTFNLVTTPFRPFQHLVSVEEQLACLRCVNHCLRTGGTLILDLYQVNLRFITNPASMDERQDFSDVELPEGRRMSRTGRITAVHPAEQYNDIEMIYHITDPDGRTRRAVQAFPFRYFFKYEVEHLLARCGFKTVHVYGDFDRSPLGNDSPEMIFIAQKVGDLV